MADPSTRHAGTVLPAGAERTAPVLDPSAIAVMVESRAVEENPTPMRSRIRVLACAVAVSGLGLSGLTDDAPAAPNPVQPQRVLDTRSGLGARAGRLAPGETITLEIPAASAASSVVLNLTADQALEPGFVTVWPCDHSRPDTSILNVVPGQAVANMMVISLPSAGICFATSAPVHLVADLEGWFTGAGDVTTDAPNRVVDTRFTGNPLGAGEVRRVKVAGTPNVPGDAAAAALNVTVTGPAADGFLTAYPCGSLPNASTVNFRAGEDRPNFTVVQVVGGDVCLRSTVATDVIVDSFGWSSNSGSLRTFTPGRVLDTRQTGSWPYGRPVSPGAPLALRVAGKGGVPNDASAALLTITVDNAAATGFVTAWPCDQAEPDASALNLFRGVLRSNLALVRLAADGTVCLAVSTVDGSSAHLIADAVGSLTGGPTRSPPPPDPAPPANGATLPPGSALPTDAQCAAAVHRAPEVRPQNAAANATPGSSVSASYPRATGSFTGTTDEIIQWVACKWGIDADVVRAQVAKESWWTQSNLGDYTSDAGLCAPGHGIGVDGRPGQCPESVGMMQVRTQFFRDSVATALASSSYNLDVGYAVWRDCFEGHETWLNTVERGQQYGPGDMWGCIGRWFSGRWHTGPAETYISAVQDYLNQRVWTSPGFLSYTS
jgi:hypothetical protein